MLFSHFVPRCFQFPFDASALFVCGKVRKLNKKIVFPAVLVVVVAVVVPAKMYAYS